jgi:DNA-binding response OmpR family regulator
VLIAAMANPRMRALIVEDEQLLAASLADQLGRLGLTVAGIAGERAEAQRLLEDGGFDIAFIDLFLGREYHGLDLARLASARGAAVVLVTGHLSHAISDTLATLRSAALLTKPFSIDQLRAVVDAVRQTVAPRTEKPAEAGSSPSSEGSR